MITVSDVLLKLSSYNDLEDFDEEQLTIFCEHGLDWVKRHLRDDAVDDNELIALTACAMAHYYLFTKRFTETDKYTSYKVGDMTVQRNLKQEFELEKQIRDEALVQAKSILVDRGFYFHAH